VSDRQSPANDQTSTSEVKVPDPAALAQSFADIAERSKAVVAKFLERTHKTQPGSGTMDPFNIAGAFFEMTTRLMAEPGRLLESQVGLWQSYFELWSRTARKFMGEKTEPLVQPDKGDRRFRDAAWEENAIFDYIKQSYLLSSRWIVDTVEGVEGLDTKTKNKVDFYTRQFIDALAPSNFVATNPEVLRRTFETGGENLLEGLENLLEDLERGDGTLRISMTDESKFKVGENIAVTEGSVVYQNDLMQLIQYSPRTDQQFETPLLIVPPWINKFYILDLRPENSFIRWALDQGHTVFVISWVNPDASQRDRSFEDYMRLGPLEALDQVLKICGTEQANVIGYCIGGTLLACTLSVMAQRKDERVKSATFFTTMIDFSEAGELGVFIDEEQLAVLEEKMSEVGYLEGREMATTFNLLRANDLIWSFVVNNYLLGKEPFPFDLLYWNSDSTRMPCAMHSFYLRKMYLENKLIEPGGITLDGIPVDLTKVTTPCFILSTKEDHIAPWKSTYAATSLYKGQTTFVLAGSGHIAGVINPPTRSKYGYWTNRYRPKDPDQWLEKATHNEGSWWPAWETWIEKRSGAKVDARAPQTPLEPAPGSYVKAKA